MCWSALAGPPLASNSSSGDTKDIVEFLQPRLSTLHKRCPGSLWPPVSNNNWIPKQIRNRHVTNKTLNTKGVAARKILKYACACLCSSWGVQYVYLVFISVFLCSSSSRLWSYIPHTWGEVEGAREHPSNAAIINGSALIGPGENSSALFSLISQQM